MTPRPLPGQQEFLRPPPLPQIPPRKLSLIRPLVKPLKISLLLPLEEYFFSLIQDEINSVSFGAYLHQVYKTSITYFPIEKEKEKREKGKHVQSPKGILKQEQNEWDQLDIGFVPSQGSHLQFSSTSSGARM